MRIVVGVILGIVCLVGCARVEKDIYVNYSRDTEMGLVEFAGRGKVEAKEIVVEDLELVGQLEDLGDKGIKKEDKGRSDDLVEGEVDKSSAEDGDSVENEGDESTFAGSFQALGARSKVLVIRELICFPDDVQDYSRGYLSEEYILNEHWRGITGSGIVDYRERRDDDNFEVKDVAGVDGENILRVQFLDGLSFIFRYNVDTVGNLNFLGIEDAKGE